MVCWIQLYWAFPNCTGRLSCVKVRPKGFTGNRGCFGCLQPVAVPRRAERDTSPRTWLRWGRWQRAETGDNALPDTGGSHHQGVDATYPILHYLKWKHLGQFSNKTKNLGLSSTQKLLHAEKETGKDFTVLSEDQNKVGITAQTIHLWKNTTSLFQFV